MKSTYLLLTCAFLWSCQGNSVTNDQSDATIEFQNKGHEIVYKMTQKAGNYEKLASLKDVVYTYTYTTPDGKEDISTEKYIFDGELSYGSYDKHERTFPDLEGRIEQGFDGNSFWLKNNGASIKDEKSLERVTFNRKTNFYWFAMFQKLLDPGLHYKYIKEATIDGNSYDVVEITFTSEDGKPTDIYQLYVNKETALVDRFLFTVVDFNVVEIPNLMKVEYEDINGLLIPTKRKYTKANWDGEILNEDWINVHWTDIKFNNNLTKKQFE